MEKRWDLGFRQITTSAKPIEKAADLAGMKLRVPGAPALVSLFTALGASPVSMQFGEVYTSLQTRIVDGQENPLSVIDAGKFYEVQKYCAVTNHVWDGYWICANPS
jgi:TRAP-type C4-dicarboxylate transport system substrate-binding protein